jgi:Lon protease-like protein
MEIPIFPLPNVVLFPHTLLPLHIFEARYRQMLADCLAGERRLAVVLLKQGWEADYYGRPPVCSVAGAGEIVASEGLPDGRSNVLLKGLGRIMIEGEIPSPKPYRIARASWLQDVYRSGSEGDLASGVDRLRHLCGELVSQLPEPVPALLEILTQRDSPGVFVDRLSSLVMREPEERQRLLELSDVQQRIAEVIAYLEALVGRMKQGSLRARARWN